MRHMPDRSIEVLGDLDRRASWMLLADGVPQSHVDLDDPRYLGFEYVRRLGHLVDLAAPAGQPIRVLHLGGGALTLARYVAATRPGSAQLAVDNDAELVAIVRERLPLPRRRANQAGIIRCRDRRHLRGGPHASSPDLCRIHLRRGERPRTWRLVRGQHCRRPTACARQGEGRDGSFCVLARVRYSRSWRAARPPVRQPSRRRFKWRSPGYRAGQACRGRSVSWPGHVRPGPVHRGSEADHRCIG
jgi:hypothetical protein